MKRVFAVLLTLVLLMGIALAERITVRTAVDNVYLRNQNGSIITSVPQGGLVEIAGYNASLDMFSAFYAGIFIFFGILFHFIREGKIYDWLGCFKLLPRMSFMPRLAALLSPCLFSAVLDRSTVWKLG